MSQHLVSGYKKWQLIGKQSTKNQSKSFNILQQPTNFELTASKQYKINDIYDNRLTYNKFKEISSNPCQIESNLNGIDSDIKIVQSPCQQKQDMIYQSQQLSRDSYGIYPNVSNDFNTETGENDHSEIIQSISFNQDMRKNQQQSLIHELENISETKIQTKFHSSANIYQKQQQNKKHKIILQLKNTYKTIKQLKKSQQNIKNIMNQFSGTSNSLFINNKQLQQLLMNQLKQFMNKRNKQIKLQKSKSRESLNESFMKGLNQSMQILQSSQKQLKSAKIIQKLMKSLENNEYTLNELKKKLNSKQNQNNKLKKDIQIIKDQNEMLINQKQQLLQEVFTLQQQIVGVNLQIQDKVKKTLQQMNYLNSSKKNKQKNTNNEVYLQTIEQLSKQITILNEKCTKYENFIIQKQNILTSQNYSKQDEEHKRKIQKQLQQKQKYLLELQTQIQSKNQKIKEKQFLLNKKINQIQQQQIMINEKEEQLKLYNLQLNQKQENLYQWQMSLQEQDKLLTRKVNELQRDKLLHIQSLDVHSKDNMSVTHSHSHKLVQKIDHIKRATPAFERTPEFNADEMNLDLKKVQKDPRYHRKQEPNSQNQHKKTNSSYSRKAYIIHTDNDDNHSVHHQNSYQIESGQRKKYQPYFNLNNNEISRNYIHKYEHKPKLNLYSSNVNDNKSVLVDDILAKRRRQINKIVDNRRPTKNNLLQGIFTEAEIQKIKSPSMQSYKQKSNNNIRHIFDHSNNNYQEKEKFQSRKVYEFTSKNQDRIITNKNSRTISSQFNKSSINQRNNYKRYDKKTIGLENLNQKLERLKEDIKKQVQALE